MKSTACLFILSLFLPGCHRDISQPGNETGDWNHYERTFDFSDSGQLRDLPSYGTDPSYIENEQLKSPIAKGEHKGLGRKFHFKYHGGEPDEAEMEFSLWLAANFQENGVDNEAGKFSGFEGIYDSSAGWGGKRVTTQKSWSVRIAHGCENSEGKIPIGLYVYHPGMPGKYGTTIVPGFSLNKEQRYTLKLYIRMNDIDKGNGVLRLSVDGDEIYSADSWTFRNAHSVHIKSVWLDTYIGGLTPSRSDTYTLMDDLVIRW
ncbi:MAG: hypothetical protein CSA96_01495 [Bacteroidetes bacterium]|nr:MAG: hypothetical protein CSA96_01495 [Bacteroidota bacterium]